MVESLISFRNFSFQYESQAEETLKDINLDIYPGEKVLIAGASGSGKSTLGRCINGLIPHAYPGVVKGNCFVNGKSVVDSSLFELSFDVGTVLQDSDSQFVGLTVAEDIAFSLENDCIAQEEMKRAVANWSQKLKLTELLQHSPQEISGGQKQRVAMAGVLIDESQILLFDEPLASLDPAAEVASMQLIENLAKKQGLTVVIIEHRIEEVLFADIDRLVILQDGKIVANGKPANILKTSKLKTLGLREPLYISAVKKSGISIETCKKIEHPETIEGAGLADKLIEWTAKTNLLQKKGSDTELLRLSNLNFAYENGKRIISNLSLTINQGEIISLVGRNGTGKSTLSNIITGFLEPQSGSMYLREKNLTDLSVKQRASYIGYILQDPNQMISKTTVYDEVASGLELRKVTKEKIEKRVKKILQICGLYEMRNWPITALSFGQKKRVTIAAILVLEPEIIILDEPTAGQDLKHYTEIMTFLEELQKKRQLTIILITHDMHLMLEYTNRTIVLDGGKIIKDDVPARVLTDENILQRASLAKTSLYTLAERFNVPSATDFVAKFIQAERQER